MLFVFSVFFFKETATTVIYTYLHTLSLHDALPISNPWRHLPPRWSAGHLPSAAPLVSRSRNSSDRISRESAHQIAKASVIQLLKHGTCHAPRSEEHTSELQSLMRISYAVFCLKKKKHTYQSHRTANGISK